MQAKDINDDTVLGIIRMMEDCTRLPVGLWEIQKTLPSVPPKVVLAKLRSLLKRKLVTGCGCGCRGDFRVIARV